MSIKEKLESLLEKVLEGTRQGKIIWQETADEDTFSTNLTAGAIFLARRYTADENSGSEWEYEASLYNKQGKLAEELAVGDNRFLRQLYEEARRSARATGGTIDSLLSEMQELLG